MKSFVLLFALVAVAAANYGNPSYGGYGESKGYGGGHESGGYGGYAEPGPSKSYGYAAAAPKAQCGYNLLVGCAPQVAHVPCIPSKGGHGGGYGKSEGGYGKSSGGYGGGYGKSEGGHGGGYSKSESGYGKSEGGYGGGKY